MHTVPHVLNLGVWFPNLEVWAPSLSIMAIVISWFWFRGIDKPAFPDKI